MRDMRHATVSITSVVARTSVRKKFQVSPIEYYEDFMQYNLTLHVEAEALDAVSIRDSRELHFQVLSPASKVSAFPGAAFKQAYIPRDGLRANGDADSRHSKGEDEEGEPQPSKG